MYVNKNLNIVKVQEYLLEDGNYLVVEVNKVTVIASYRPLCFTNPNNYITSLNDLLLNTRCKYYLGWRHKYKYLIRKLLLDL